MALELDYSTRIINQAIARLSEEEFWKLVSSRLNIPLSKDQILQYEISSDSEEVAKREYLTEECLIDEIFLQLARTKEVVNHNGKSVNVYKYYHQAFQLRNWIPIAKPAPVFIINISDLTTIRIIAELKTLDDPQYVLKQAVGRIFENIDFRQYHLSIAKKLRVRLDK